MCGCARAVLGARLGAVGRLLVGTMRATSILVVFSSVLVAVAAAFALPATSNVDRIFSDRFEPPPRFFLDENGVTIRCPDAEIGEQGEVNGVIYMKRSRDQITTENADTTCTSGIYSMVKMFAESIFRQTIEIWDNSSVVSMSGIFSGSNFNQPILAWDTSSVMEWVIDEPACFKDTSAPPGLGSALREIEKRKTISCLLE